MQNHALRCGGTAQFIRSKRSLHEIDHGSCTEELQERLHGGRTIGEIIRSLKSRDVPEIAGRVFHIGSPLAPLLIRRSLQRFRPLFLCQLPRGIHIGHVDVERHRSSFAVPLHTRTAASHLSRVSPISNSVWYPPADPTARSFSTAPKTFARKSFNAGTFCELGYAITVCVAIGTIQAPGRGLRSTEQWLDNLIP